MVNKYFSSIYGEGTGTKLVFLCLLRKQKEQKGWEESMF